MYVESSAPGMLIISVYWFRNAFQAHDTPHTFMQVFSLPIGIAGTQLMHKELYVPVFSVLVLCVYHFIYMFIDTHLYYRCDGNV